MYATSEDLFSWSDLAVLREVSTDAYPQQKYASVLDLDLEGVDANYQATGASPWLFYTRLNADNDRDIVRQQLEVTLRKG